MAHAESAGTEGAWAGLGASGAPGDSGAPGSAGPGDAGDSGAPGSAGPGDAADSGAPGSAGSDLGDVAGSRDAEGSPGRHRSPDDATAAPAVHALALLAIPAAVVGIASSLVLLAISYLAGQVERFLFLGGGGVEQHHAAATVVRGGAAGVVDRDRPTGDAGPEAGR